MDSNGTKFDINWDEWPSLQRIICRGFDMYVSARRPDVPQQDILYMESAWAKGYADWTSWPELNVLLLDVVPRCSPVGFRVVF